MELNLPLILIAALLATASLGPATLAIAGTCMASGRISGLILASGITTGSLFWSTSAALGLGAVMQANSWIFEVVRYSGATYLIFLAYQSARSAVFGKTIYPHAENGSKTALFVKGLLLHIANPKAILFFGSLYSIGVPAEATFPDLTLVVAAVGLQSFAIFHGYALAFSSRPVIRYYLRFRRGFEGLFAIGFGAAGVKILAARLH